MSSVFFWLLVIIVAYSIYAVRKKQKTIQALKSKQLSLNHSVRQLQERFKLAVSVLADLQSVNVEGKRKLNGVANNYFVFQAVNPLTVGHFSDLVDMFVNTVTDVEDTEKHNDVRFVEICEQLCLKIPSDTRGFSADYYLHLAPSEFYDFASEVEALNSVIETETETEIDPNVELSEEARASAEQAAKMDTK